MGANKFKFRIPRDGDKYINLPVEIKWDFLGQDDSVDKFEDEVVRDVIGGIDDYEVGRFAHQPYNTNTNTDIKYDFHFFNGLDINTSVDSDWTIRTLKIWFFLVSESSNFGWSSWPQIFDD